MAGFMVGLAVEFWVEVALLALGVLLGVGCGDGGPSDAQRSLGTGAAELAAGDAGTATIAPSLGVAFRQLLRGRSARTLIHDEVNEAENLFFTPDGRLFVSGAEDIYEIKRAPDGTFTKTDHFHDNCIVEGIVYREGYLYGVCWDPNNQAFLIAGEITDDPVFVTVADLGNGTTPNGMAIGPDGRIYVTYFGTNQIMRLSLAGPMTLSGVEVWADGLPFVNGIKYVDGFMYVTLLNLTLVSEFVRIPVLDDGRAGTPEPLLARPLSVLDDIIPFEDGFVLTDYLAGTLIFWSEMRGTYAETPPLTFYGPTSLAQGRPPMFDERQLIVAEKGLLFVRDEAVADLLSAYRLP